MKISTKTYLLLFTALGIWGTLAFKAIAGLKPNTQATKEEVSANFIKPTLNQDLDTFSIQKVERDPFLGGFVKARKKKKLEPGKKTVLPKEQFNPAISYLGLIKNNKSRDEIFIIKIDGVQYLMKEGENVNGIKLIKGGYQDIKMKYKKRTLTIPKD